MKENVPFICLGRETGKKTIHKAGWVLIDPYTILENGCIEFENGKISRVFQTDSDLPNQDIIDHGPGVIMPPLVNAHVHLELSALKNSLPFDRGFAAWVQALLKKREATKPDILILQAKKAAQNFSSQGVGMIGEISTLGITKQIVLCSNLSGVWFQEFLGSGQPDIDMLKDFPVSCSMAGHAPHTSDPKLLQAIKKRTRAMGLPFSIHLAESEEESDFIAGRKNEWGKFLAVRGIDTSLWPIGSKTPVQYLDELGVLDSFTLGVHLLNITDQDIDILKESGTRVCICPRSNENLHSKLPDIEKMVANNIKPALGTDSLASCSSLSIFDEMAFVRQEFPRIDPRQILSMATINGARALGHERYCGTLEQGKRSEFIYVNLHANTKKNLVERLTLNEIS